MEFLLVNIERKVTTPELFSCLKSLIVIKFAADFTQNHMFWEYLPNY